MGEFSSRFKFWQKNYENAIALNHRRGSRIFLERGAVGR
jgi:hypothetical protein